MGCVKAVFFVFLVACGGTVSTGDDAAPTQDAASELPIVSGGEDAGADSSADVAPLPLPVRCAQPAGAACDVTTFPPSCCLDDDGGYLSHVCVDGGVEVTSTCAP